VWSSAGDLVARELFDHDAFRRRLYAEREAEGDQLHGVLVLSEGELPPPYLRLAFLPVPLAGTAGHTLSVVRSARTELIDGIEAAFCRGLAHRSSAAPPDRGDRAAAPGVTAGDAASGGVGRLVSVVTLAPGGWGFGLSGC
jgi:hypothetical protein